MKLRWSPGARRDLKSIKAYFMERNPVASEKTGAEIIRAVQRLEVFPQLGRPAHHSNLRLMQVPELPYLIPYRVEGENIQIVAVFDERRERPADWT